LDTIANGYRKSHMTKLSHCRRGVAALAALTTLFVAAVAVVGATAAVSHESRPVGKGAGTLTTPVTNLPRNQSGDVIVFTYTAAPGGTRDGTLTITVPTGWPAPTTTNAVGCTTASTGTVSTNGRTITVSKLTLAGRAKAKITYGAISSGACTNRDGANAPKTAGRYTFAAAEASTSTGARAALATSPSIKIG
jgi:hypothetical protein